MRIAVWTFLKLALLINGCASLQTDLWPPAPGERAYPVYVSLDTWHGMIGFPPDVKLESEWIAPEPEKLHSGRGDRESEPRYEEWGYAEREWYVQGRQGVSGALRALLWPTAGTVEIARYGQPWAFRTPQPPADLFLFKLSREGFVRLRRHLFSTLAGTQPVATLDQSDFYPSRRAYHLFHQCHQYVARALQEAGLPVSPFWAFNRTTLVAQLRRAERLAEEPARLRLRANEK